MEKVIKLIMGKDKNLAIIVNDEEKHKILWTARNITAEKIYEILDYKKDDNFQVIPECESGADTQVLDFFTELFQSIVVKINAFNSDEEEPVF